MIPNLTPRFRTESMNSDILDLISALAVALVRVNREARAANSGPCDPDEQETGTRICAKRKA